MSPADLAELGFDLVQDRRDGSRQYARRAHPYLAYWLVTYADGTAELSWELALGEYIQAKGLACSAQDTLSLFVFPSGEARGPLEADWIRGATERVEQQLGSIDLAHGT
jgi:hypothetical protein